MEKVMRNLCFTIILFFLMSSCSVETEIHQCNADISDYTDFHYKFIDKQLVKEIAGDSLFKADVIIEATPKDTMIFLDSVLCYCLAICKKESLVETRFYNSIEGFEIMKKYGIKEFNARTINSIITDFNDSKMFGKSAIASFKIDQPDENWKKQISSDNLITMFPRLIQSRFKKQIEKKLLVK